MELAEAVYTLTRVMPTRTLGLLTWGDLTLPTSGDLDTATVVFRTSGPTYQGHGRAVLLAIRACKKWSAQLRPLPDLPLVVAAPSAEGAMPKGWLLVLERCGGPDATALLADSDVTQARTYQEWLISRGSYDITRAEREACEVLLHRAGLTDMGRAVEERWSAFLAGAPTPTTRRGPRAVGSVNSDPPLTHLLPGLSLELRAHSSESLALTHSRVNTWLYTLRILLKGVNGDPTVEKLTRVGLQQYDRLRAPREAWEAFRTYTSKRGLSLPAYPYQAIVTARIKARPVKAVHRMEPDELAPVDVLRAIYDLFGERKAAYNGVHQLKRNSMRYEQGEVLLPERWKHGDWARWRVLNAAQRLALDIILKWGAAENSVDEDPLIPVTPGASTPAPASLVLRALEHHNFLRRT